jgi:hypothetical protein
MIPSTKMASFSLYTIPGLSAPGGRHPPHEPVLGLTLQQPDLRSFRVYRRFSPRAKIGFPLKRQDGGEFRALNTPWRESSRTVNGGLRRHRKRGGGAHTPPLHSRREAILLRARQSKAVISQRLRSNNSTSLAKSASERVRRSTL